MTHNCTMSRVNGSSSGTLLPVKGSYLCSRSRSRHWIHDRVGNYGTLGTRQKQGGSRCMVQAPCRSPALPCPPIHNLDPVTFPMPSLHLRLSSYQMDGTHRAKHHVPQHPKPTVKLPTSSMSSLHLLCLLYPQSSLRNPPVAMLTECPGPPADRCLGAAVESASSSSSGFYRSSRPPRPTQAQD